MKEQRNDRIGRQDGARKDSRGGLRAPATPTRVGIFLYKNPDGSIRRELRHPDEVFNQDSLATQAGVPVTVKHPNEPVTSSNWRKHAVGHVGDTVKHDGRLVHTDVCVTDSLGVSFIEGEADGIELSCGYECDFDPQPGVYEGESYDGVQRNIAYNHLALLPRGHARGGPEMRLHLDEGEGVHFSSMDSKEIEKLQKEQGDLKARCDALEADNKTLRARAEAAESVAKPEAVAARVDAAVKLREDARSVLGAEKLPKTDEEIMVAVITKLDPTFKKDAIDYPLRARFDAQLALHAQSALGKVQEATRTDATAGKDPVEEARQAWMKANADAWKVK